jgi:hypothetical protein
VVIEGEEVKFLFSRKNLINVKFRRMLMCLVGNPLELQKKLAYLAPLVERLGTIDGALSSLNNRGEDALYLTAMNSPQMSFVAGYLAAACLQKNIDISQRLYRSRVS